MVIDRPCQLADQSLVYEGDVEINGNLIGPIPLLQARHICLQGSIQGPAVIIADSLGLAGGWRANRQEAVVKIKESMICRDLISVSGKIQGDFSIEGDLEACDLHVQGWIDGARAGRIWGGTLRLEVGGVLQSVLPCDQESAELILGRSKGTPVQIENLLKMIEKLQEQRDQAEGDALNRVSTMIHQAEQALSRLQQFVDGFERLEIVGKLQAGTRFVAGSEVFCVQETMFGVVVELVAGKIRVLPLFGPDT